MTTLGLGLGGALQPLGSGRSSTYTFTGTFHDTLVESLAFTEAVIVGLPADASDTLGLSPQWGVQYRQIASLVEGLGLAPVVSTLRGIVLTEILGLAPVLLPNQKVNVSAIETLNLFEQMIPGLPVTITEGLGLTVVQSIQQAIEVIEGLGLQDVLAPKATYNVAYSDTIGFAASLANFFGVEITEELGITPALSGNMLLRGELTESIGLADTQVANLVLRVSVDEGLGLEDVDLLNAIYTGAISEELRLVAAYISPGGGFTTWAMNTRTAAVTEYDNYEFNSFARLGDKYIGATSDGLYELSGDDDEGTSIVARIKSGFAQWAGSRFTVLKGVYLGVRGEGDFVLKITTGDDKTYNYAVSTHNMQTTRVRTGKGIRTRYFRFELISEGQDFDLEAVEFVPLVAERRV